MADTSLITEHMDVLSSDRKAVGKVDHLEGTDKIKLTRQSSPDGQHHHFIPVSWVDHVDQGSLGGWIDAGRGGEARRATRLQRQHAHIGFIQRAGKLPDGLLEQFAVG